MSGVIGGGERRSDDGSAIVKNDPGTADTDPKYYGEILSTSVAGANVFDLTDIGGKHLQSFQLQVRGAMFGDFVEVQFRSDGTVEAYGPPNYVVQSFGRMNPPLGTFGNGWSHRIEEPDEKVGTAKLVPTGIKVTLVYDATTSAVRDIAVDLVVQE